MTYIPNTDADRRKMLETIGASSVRDLFEQVPAELHRSTPLNVPDALAEMDLLRHMADLSCANADLDSYTSFLGAGVYDHYIPATVPAILGRSEFYTAYTPYQPELSQGNLQAIYEFQTLICQLTGMDVANASMYDGATAAAEAALMASAITGKHKWVTTECLHPSWREVLKTYAWAAGFELVEARRDSFVTDLKDLEAKTDDDTACVIGPNPNFFGSLEPLSEFEAVARKHGALFITVFNPMSLGLLKTPAEFNADISVGEGQPLGVPACFGGPLLGLFACKQAYVRHMPGRLVGATTDFQDRRGYVLTLQTREQHIRREKATSNICSNEALLALAATVYLSTVGKNGLKEVSNLCLQKAHYAAEQIAELPGYELLSSRFFNEFVVRCPESAGSINADLLESGIIGGLDLGRFYPELSDCMLLCVTEKRTAEEIDALIGGLKR